MDQPQPTSSRSSFSDHRSSVQGPTPTFDTHLRYISDSYLAFFQERKRIEEAYIDSLKRLHRKIRAVDAQLDERGDLSTTRSAWGEIVENVDRESQARQAFLATLTVDESQERTRQRIKEDIKESTAAYTEYAENVLPKLKNRYTKRFYEVEEQKRANSPLPPNSPPQSSEPGSYLDRKAGGSGGQSSRPSVTNPQPLRALNRRPSGGHTSSRNRSPSGGTGLSELAHHGKNQMKQIIGGFLDKRGQDGLSSREDQTLQAVRAKREAEEADKEYRKGVHWLETLRLRRTKILTGAYKSLEMFIEDSTNVLKRALERYSDNLIATYTTQTQLSSHVRTFVDRISPAKDLQKLAASMPRSLALAVPDPILYEHGQVGACNDLIFGFSLVDYATAKGLQEGEVPKIVRICVEEIDKRGLLNEGIYRVSGRHAVVHALQHDLEKDESEFEFTPKDDIYAIASLLKLYLRELPEPVFKFTLQDRVQHTEGRAEHLANNFILLRSKIRRLPPVHQATLKLLIEHLGRVVAHSDKNKMDPKNLAIVFGGVIFGEDEMPKAAGDLLAVQSWKDTLMEDLIMNASRIFDPEGTSSAPQPPPVVPGPAQPQQQQPPPPPQQQQQAHNSPPLPPTPATEPVPAIYYGSKSTKVTTVPAVPGPKSPSTPSASFVASPISPESYHTASVAGSPQDFAPRLPPRPASSIHPSSRNNNGGNGNGGGSNHGHSNSQSYGQQGYREPPPPPPSSQQQRSSSDSAAYPLPPLPPRVPSLPPPAPGLSSSASPASPGGGYGEFVLVSPVKPSGVRSPVMGSAVPSYAAPQPYPAGASPVVGGGQSQSAQGQQGSTIVPPGPPPPLPPRESPPAGTAQGQEEVKPSTPVQQQNAVPFPATGTPQGGSPVRNP